MSRLSRKKGEMDDSQALVTCSAEDPQVVQRSCRLVRCNSRHAGADRSAHRTVRRFDILDRAWRRIVCGESGISGPQVRMLLKRCHWAGWRG